jgi:hypothetical protein
VAGVGVLHSTVEVGELAARGPGGGKGGPSHGAAVGQQGEDTEPQHPVYETAVDSRTQREAVTRRAVCLGWASTDLWEARGLTPGPTRRSRWLWHAGLMMFVEDVVVCDTCGFAALVGFRLQEWGSYQMASSQSHDVIFSFCTACGVTHCQARNQFSRQPGLLSVKRGRVELAPWVPATPSRAERSGDLEESAGSEDRCSACGAAGTLLRSVEEPAALNSFRCPGCWSGSLRFSAVRPGHPRW